MTDHAIRWLRSHALNNIQKGWKTSFLRSTMFYARSPGSSIPPSTQATAMTMVLEAEVSAGRTFQFDNRQH
ncbi:hypothetical protein H4Q26_015452 [Puccinia striiformis f. sp. tritici PST-130]|nr:hypothetical protein H4Q26_015452 [Puccinia striiformis f. sp. tritici PST-130]